MRKFSTALLVTTALTVLAVTAMVMYPHVGHSQPDGSEKFFQTELPAVCLGGFGCGRVDVPIVVPNGKTLVVEHVSVLATVPLGQTVAARVGVGNPTHHLVLTPQLSTATEQWYTASQPIKIFVSPGDSFSIVTNASGSGGQMLTTISGVFVSSP